VKIGLLECDNVVGRFPTVEGGYREMFAALLQPHTPQLRFSYYEAWRGELPAQTDACDAWLCTGSQYSVYDKLDWIDPLQGFVKKLYREKKPFVGVCFGHQLLAQALGGEVARAKQGWGVGVHEMTILEPEPWMEPPLARCRLQYMHQDQVQRLPGASTLLARAAHCEVAMFRVGDSMLGIEGHPEFTLPYSEALIRARRERIGTERTEAALASLARQTDAAAIARWILQFFTGSVRRGSRSA
jgi:GMP synthase-like glutamine amidotransferase